MVQNLTKCSIFGKLSYNDTGILILYIKIVGKKLNTRKNIYVLVTLPNGPDPGIHSKSSDAVD